MNRTKTISAETYSDFKVFPHIFESIQLTKCSLNSKAKLITESSAKMTETFESFHDFERDLLSNDNAHANIWLIFSLGSKKCDILSRFKEQSFVIFW
jgi:hypothetical protein